MITFSVNGEVRVETQIEPSMTVLEYLRTVLVQTGTKEGCASGDCGACTVLLAQEVDGSIQYQAINSCIALLASCNNKHLVTVEGLAKLNEPDKLHPIQQAMVDKHGSQCGFCTPGFVMSLVGVQENNSGSPLDEAQVLDAISGNLCRCTGYRPIVDAALASNDYAASPPLTNLPELDTSATGQLSATGCRAFMPTSEAELASAVFADPSARIIAGGTDLMLEKTQALKPLPQLIGVSQVGELRQWQHDNGVYHVGAAVTYSELEHSFSEHIPPFAQLLHRLGSRQIRNLGTLVGNIANASPIGDTPPVLLALDGEVEIASSAGNHWHALSDFFIDYKKTLLEPSQYLRQAKFSLPGPAEFFQIYKISKRFEDDISAVLMAVRWQIINAKFSNVRVAMGGMAAIPKRAVAVEAALEGQLADESTVIAASKLMGHDFAPLTDVRASSKYRLQVAENLLLKAWLECSDPNATVGVWAPSTERRCEQNMEWSQ